MTNVRSNAVVSCSDIYSRDRNSIFSSMLIVRKGSREWEYMWRKLAKKRINRKLNDPSVAANPDSWDDSWGYGHTEERGWWVFKRHVHFFYHECHPSTGCEEEIKIRASSLFTLD